MSCWVCLVLRSGLYERMDKACCPQSFSISAWQSRRWTKGVASTSTSNPSARCVRHEPSCSRCHATPCTIDLVVTLSAFEVVLVIFSLRRLSEIHEVSLRGTSVVVQLVLVVVDTSFQLSLVHVSPSGDDSIIARHLDISVLLPEVGHFTSCIDRQSVPLLCTLYLKCIPSDRECVSQSLLSPKR